MGTEFKICTSLYTSNSLSRFFNPKKVNPKFKDVYSTEKKFILVSLIVIKKNFIRLISVLPINSFYFGNVRLIEV